MNRMQPIIKIAMINELMRLRFGLGMTVLLVSSPLMLKEQDSVKV